MVYRDMEIGDGEFYIFFTFLLLLFMEKFDFFFFFCLGVFVQVGWSMDMEIVFTGFFLQVHIFEAVIAYAIENYIGLVFYLFCSFFFLSAPPRPRGRSWDLNAWFVYCGVQCNLQIRITVWNILAELFFFFFFSLHLGAAETRTCSWWCDSFLFFPDRHHLRIFISRCICNHPDFCTALIVKWSR